jgi:glycosyltransferase involved in cell wall biosynthesis
MKIVYFIDHLRPDGSQTVLRQLVEGLGARGHDQTIICLNDSWDDILVGRLRAAGADVCVVGKLALGSGYGLFSIWRRLRSSRFDVAVTLLFVSDVIGRAIARIAGIPFIVTTLQTRNVDYTTIQRLLVRSTMPFADLVIISSIHLREFGIAEEGANLKRIRVIPHSTRVEDYNTPRGQLSIREEFGLPSSGWLLGTVGRLTYQKGFDILLHALSLSRRNDFSLLIFGVGEDESKLRALVAKLNLGERVCFAGYRRDMPCLLGSLDLYIQPSRFEGMPLALLEAMAAACPIVATRVDGNIDLIEDGTHGWLVPAENTVMLASAIDEAISDRDEARRRGAAARRRVATRFSVDAMVLAWEKILLGKGKERDGSVTTEKSSLERQVCTARKR